MAWCLQILSFFFKVYLMGLISSVFKLHKLFEMTVLNWGSWCNSKYLILFFFKVAFYHFFTNNLIKRKSWRDKFKLPPPPTTCTDTTFYIKMFFKNNFKSICSCCCAVAAAVKLCKKTTTFHILSWPYIPLPKLFIKSVWMIIMKFQNWLCQALT